MLAVVAHEAKLARPTTDGTATRAHLRRAAAMGHRDAAAELAHPPFPDALDYLHEWFVELRAGRGEGFHGVAPLTYEGIDAWARRTDQHPEPHEVHALLLLDAAWRSALQGDDSLEPVAEPVQTPAWPTKRGG